VLSTQTESDEFKGIAQFNDESKIVIKDTNFLHAFTKGGVLILEEINLPDAGLMAGLINQAGEAPYIVLKSNGEQVKRHPLCAMYATMNVGTAGTTPLNESLSSRFPATYVLPNAKKEAFIQALFAKYGNRFTEKQAGWAYDIFTSTHKFLRQNNIQADNIALAVSQRSCFELLKQIEVTGDVREALEDTFYGKVYSYDPEVAEQLKNILDITAGAFPAA
jgi:midasin (ATPase involved in ribosome maturation)